MSTVRPAKHLVGWFLRKFGYGGITLPPFGIYVLPHRMEEQRLLRHERAHWAQYQRMGFVRYYVLYIYYSMRYGYWNNPMEHEARSAE